MTGMRSIGWGGFCRVDTRHETWQPERWSGGAATGVAVPPQKSGAHFVLADDRKFLSSKRCQTAGSST